MFYLKKNENASSIDRGILILWSLSMHFFSASIRIRRLQTGLSSIPSNFVRGRELEKQKKSFGLKTLTFTDYKFLEHAKDDFWKFARFGLTLCVSQEIAFYTYLIIPIMSSASNPWAWKVLPSGFDLPADKDMRDQILVKRRQTALLNSLQFLLGQTIDDVDVKTKTERSGHVHMLEEALKAKSTSGALKVLESWFTNPGLGDRNKGGAATSAPSSEKNGKSGSATMGRIARVSRNGKTSAPGPSLTGTSSIKTKSAVTAVSASKGPQIKLRLDQVPWLVIKDCCRAFGLDGVPNIFLVRMVNRNELERYFERLRQGDEFLLLRGVDSLDPFELTEACHERCISVADNRSDAQLRNDLSEWLELASAQTTDPLSTSSSSVPVRLNDQNRRFAMCALHVAREMRSSEFSAVARAAFGNK